MVTSLPNVKCCTEKENDSADIRAKLAAIQLFFFFDGNTNNSIDDAHQNESVAIERDPHKIYRCGRIKFHN